MEYTKPVIKSQNPKYKEELKKTKIDKITILEEFMSSEGFKQYMELLNSSIVNITKDILNDLSEQEIKPIHSNKELKIMLRKELVKLRDNPVNTLKLLSTNLDKLGSTQ